MEISITSIAVFSRDKSGKCLYNLTTRKNVYKEVYYIRICGNKSLFAVEDQDIANILKMSTRKYRATARKCHGQLSFEGNGMEFDHYESAKEFYNLLMPWIIMAVISYD